MIQRNADIFTNMKYKYYEVNTHIKFPNKSDFIYYYVYHRGRLIVEGDQMGILQPDMHQDYQGANTTSELRSKGYTVEEDNGGDRYDKAMNSYRKYQQKLDQEFKEDAIAQVLLTYHPKADKIFAYAEREGHSNGYVEILMILDEIAALFLED